MRLIFCRRSTLNPRYIHCVLVFAIRNYFYYFLVLFLFKKHISHDFSGMCWKGSFVYRNIIILSLLISNVKVCVVLNYW